MFKPVMTLHRLFKLHESGPPDLNRYGAPDGSPAEAENLLRSAIKSGQKIAGTERMWRLKDQYIGLSIHDADEGWGLVWTCPVAATRMGIDQRTAHVGSPNAEVIDPLSSEVDDFAIVVNWISPDRLAAIIDIGN